MGKIYSRGTEGFAFGKTDANGYNNLEAIDKNELMRCSWVLSHIEEYNIGVSNHALSRCLNNFETAVNEYSSADYIVIETTSIKPSISDMKKLEDSTFARLATLTNPIVIGLQKIPLFRRFYARISNIQVGKAYVYSPNVVESESFVKKRIRRDI